MPRITKKFIRDLKRRQVLNSNLECDEIWSAFIEQQLEKQTRKIKKTLSSEEL